MSLADELTKLRDLHESGALSDSEYATAKAHLLNEWQHTASPTRPVESPAPQDLRRRTNQWATLLHLSQLVAFIFPPGGILAPILIWRIKKDELPEIDAHGCNVVNWLITATGVGIVLHLLGTPSILVLLVLVMGFPVIAAIKAFHGEAWRYPLSFPFITPEEAPVKPPPKRRTEAGEKPRTVTPGRPYGW